MIFSGLAPRFVGLHQIHFCLPAGVSSGPAVPIAIRIGGVESPAGVSRAVE